LQQRQWREIEQAGQQQDRAHRRHRTLRRDHRSNVRSRRMAKDMQTACVDREAFGLVAKVLAGDGDSTRTGSVLQGGAVQFGEDIAHAPWTMESRSGTENGRRKLRQARAVETARAANSPIL
jgi:hypothetical protein